MTVLIDFETKSALDLKKVGAYRYVEDSEFEPILLACAVNDEPIEVLEGAAILAYLRAHEGETFCGWGNFDRVILDRLGIRYNKYIDASICAAEYGWPLKLELASQAAGLPAGKNKRGTVLIQKFSKPRRAKAGPRWNDRTTHPQEWDEFRDYAGQDLVLLRDIYKRLPPLRPDEEALRLLDQRLNDRGVRVDLHAVLTLHGLRAEVQEQANQRLATVTDGAVTTASQVDALVAWTGLPDMRKDTVEAALQGEYWQLSDDVRVALECRQLGSKSSGSKLDAFLATVSEDGRVRGTIQFCGAHTRRWAGRGIQPQNLPRDAYSPDKVEALLAAAPDGVEEVEQVMGCQASEAISSALRGMLVPSEGKVLLVADYAQIEARVLAWYAGQESALALYRSGGDVYRNMASDVFGVAVEDVTGDQRFFGKTLVLGAGFMLGALKLQGQLAGKGVAVDLDAAQEYIDGYRNSYDRVTRMWSLIKTAMMAAIREPGRTKAYWSNKATDTAPKLRFRFDADTGILSVMIANGMLLRYHGARIDQVPAPWDAAQKIDAVTAMARTQAGWMRRSISPGLATENIVQSTARELLKEAMLAADAEGLELLLTVHDEVIAEGQPEDLPRLVACMERVPPWATGLPLAVEAKVMKRYGK